MKAGFFETDITPPVGMEKPGGYGKAYCADRRDPLKVRAGVFDDGESRVALVGIDTCVIGERTVAEARQEIQDRCGIDGGSVMIGASHTHSGGPLFGMLPEDVADAPELVRELALNHSTVIDPLYHGWAVRQIATAVIEADRRKEDAEFSIGSGREDAGVFNRRLKMRDGRAASHPGKGNPDIVDFAGPVDPEVGVLAAWRADGSLIGCVVNYACHGTTGPGGVSADWICYLEEAIRAPMGSDVVVVPLNGACGDVTQVNNLSMGEREFGEKYAQLVGGRVGAEAVKVMTAAEKGTDAPVAAETTVLRIPRRAPSPGSLAKARALMEANPPSAGSVEDGSVIGKAAQGARKTGDWVFAKERLILEWLIEKEPVRDVEVQAVQVGPAVFLSNPAEFFCALGLEIKERSPFPFTFVVELANGSAGYVPTADALGPEGGGYETVLTSYSNLIPDAGSQIVEASVDLAKRLTPGDVPQRPQSPSPGAPWEWGKRGPELD